MMESRQPQRLATQERQLPGARTGRPAWPATLSYPTFKIDVMTGLEAASSLAVQLIAELSGAAGTRAVRRWPSGRARRAARRAAYEELASAVIRARLRVDVLHAVHAAQMNPLNVPAVLTGFSVVTAAVDRTLVDLGEVVVLWQRVRADGASSVQTAAEELVVVLAELLRLVQPGWWRPLRRVAHRQDRSAAAARFDRALREFARCSRADAAGSRSDRKRARRSSAV